ncbi:NAD-dependent epimerase/dehydratase family protein [Streptomyces rubiginosohelvolus]|uniref:NAD-dependent epimerase/dehydratase family protein n=1 Tax=Streptomyces rubiginosohelvolus TaxID=67362 RepID=UPI0035DF34D6
MNATHPPRATERVPSTVVLGASGYLGSVIGGLLASRPGRVRLVARRPCAVPEGAVATVETVRADLTDDAAVAAAVADADVVLHLAKHAGDWRLPEREPAATGQVNVGVMRALLAALAARSGASGAGTDAGDPARPPLVVFAGACTQIGHTPDRPMDGTEPDHPETAYDQQKLAAENLLMEATRVGAVRGVSLRLATVFGQSPLSAVPDAGVVVTMIRKALAGEPLTMWHDGTVMRDLTYVEDVGRAFLAAVDRPEGLIGRHWMIGTGRHEPLGEVFRTVASAVAAATGLPPVPVVTVTPPGAAVVTDFLNVYIDPAPFGAACGWSARVPLREGIDRTVHALLSAGPLPGSPVQSTAPTP